MGERCKQRRRPGQRPSHWRTLCTKPGLQLQPSFCACPQALHCQPTLCLRMPLSQSLVHRWEARHLQRPVSEQQWAAAGWLPLPCPELLQPQHCQLAGRGLLAGPLHLLCPLLWLPAGLAAPQAACRREQPWASGLVRMGGGRQVSCRLPVQALAALLCCSTVRQRFLRAEGWESRHSTVKTTAPAPLSLHACRRRRAGRRKLPRKHQAWLPPTAHRRHFRGGASLA